MQRKYSGWQLVLVQFLLFILLALSVYYEVTEVRREFNFALYAAAIFLLLVGIGGLIITIITFKQGVTPLPYPGESARLIQSGIYSSIRHPMYLFITIASIGVCLYFNAYNSLIFCAALALFFDYKVRKEEMYLKKKFPEYAVYQKTTKKFIPYVY